MFLKFAALPLLGNCRVITSIPFGELDDASNVVDYFYVTEAKELDLQYCCHPMTVA
jgi:hypothetical protein